MCFLPLDALWQQKTRTVLTTMGVIFGTFVLTASLSTNQGVEDVFQRELGHADVLRRIQVWQQPASTKMVPKKTEIKGQMSDARRERIREALSGPPDQVVRRPPGKVLDENSLRAIAQIDHVEAAIPLTWQFGVATVDGHKWDATTFGVLPNSDDYRKRLLAGRFLTDDHERSAVISELLAYRLGFADDAALNSLIGKKLRFQSISQQFRDLLGRLRLSAKNVPFLGSIMGKGNSANPDGQTAEELMIAGVYRVHTPKEKEDDEGQDPLQPDTDMLLPWRTAADMYFKLQRTTGSATVIADRESNIESVLPQIKAMGFEGRAFREGIKRERLMYSLIFRSMTCIAAVALFVAALGIANTMLMSVLERTREIGVMKAIGAGNGQLQLIFLIEGALIGLVGGGLGLLLAWGASIPGDLWVRAMVSRDIKFELKSAIFVFPPWIILSVMIFAVLVTTLAAVYPARRAARIDPVAALRHE
jgi:putative ABC transport system permease protein